MGDVEDLSEEQYCEYKGHLDQVACFQARANLYRLVELNYREWRSGLDKAWATLIEDHGFYQRGSTLEDLMLQSNRRLLNWLAAVRTYLDHTSHALATVAPEGAQKGFEKETSRLYEGHFAHRFLYRLRNYAQHRGLPINATEMSFHLGQDGAPVYFQLIGVNRDLLLEYRKWSTVRDDLIQQPAVFSAEELVDEMMGCLKDLSDTADALHLGGLLGSVSFIRQFVRPAVRRPGNPCILTGYHEHVAASVANKENPDPDFSSSVSIQKVPLDWLASVETRAVALGLASDEAAASRES